MKYTELTYALPEALAEEAGQILVDAGAAGIEERDGATIERPEVGQVLLVAWIDPPAVDAFVARAAIGLQELAAPTQPLRLERDEDEWRDAWKRYFHARPVGRFVIVPSWETYAPTPGEIVLDLDPGRAFGTGGHASTRLCLRALDQVAGPVQRILDVGCGSGVLGIAAAKRWPDARGDGVDIDPDAIEVLLENAERNGVHTRLTFSTRGAQELERADLIFANIQPEVLIPMAPTLMDRRGKSGTLILAGIIDAAADSVIAAYASLGTPRVLREEGWTALVYS